MTNKEPPDEWGKLTATAAQQVAQSQQGDYLAGLEIVGQSAIALRGLLQNDDPPDPYRKVFLGALLTSLERIERGEEPTAALNLKKPAHRIKDPNTEPRDVLVFVQVGQELERILDRGSSGGSVTTSPVKAAIQAVAHNNAMSFQKVQKVWTENGSRAGWDACKSDWN